MLAEGRDAIFERQAQAGAYVRERAKAMGLKLFANHNNASNTVTAIWTPENVNTKALLKTLGEQDKVVLADGQDHMKGKIFRVGHLGYFTQNDLEEAMNAVERRLREAGFEG